MILRAFAAFVALWPDAATRAAARALGTLWWSVFRYRRAVIEENLARAFPDRSPRERAVLGRAACIHLVQTLFEVLRIPRLTRTVRLEGLEHYEAAKRRGKGVFFLSGHLGSFELAMAAAAPHVAPVSVVVKSFPGAIDRFIDQTRRAAGLGVIRAEGATRPILRALAANEAVVFVLDQNATRNIGVFVDFFGHRACTMSALAILALRSEAAVLGVTMYREPSGQNVLRIDPPIAIDQTEHRSTREQTITPLTQLFTRYLERAIREHPEQWLWTHKRWRTQPAALNTPSSEQQAS